MSEKHANFIVNDQRGSAADVRRLAERVRREVEGRFGVRLDFEIVFLGDWSDWPPGDEAVEADEANEPNERRQAAGERPVADAGPAADEGAE